MSVNCRYYVGEGKCLIGDCYISKMEKVSSQKILEEHLENCISKKVITEKYLNRFSKKLEMNLNKNL